MTYDGTAGLGRYRIFLGLGWDEESPANIQYISDMVRERHPGAIFAAAEVRTSTPLEIDGTKEGRLEATQAPTSVQP